MKGWWFPLGKKQIVYYAHCMKDYGSDMEKEHVKILERLGYYVLNPNDPRIDSVVDQMQAEGKTSSEIMDYFLTIVKKCDVLAFATTTTGKVSAGVKKEIDYMKSLDRPVFQLPIYSNLETMSVDETRKFLKER